MRILFLVMLTVAAISAASSARAQNYNPRYPVCMRVIEMFGGARTECRYHSRNQCAQRAAGLAATCILNPFYRGPR
ncbi:DUF3551 domain-containing protein [Bradyrhizobium sp.]|uniref:DUF3551 domain-containing protein n=1 Tax=Bradyrhizobium sp. TaxID=376 RepID=UPI0040378500